MTQISFPLARGFLAALLGTAAFALGGCAVQGDPAVGGPLQPIVLASQGSFFIGGRDIKSDTLSTLPAYAASGTVTVEQMYVHYQVPATRSGAPITMIHGCCLTGKTWETTPDGRMGWDEYFVRRGFPVYVIDQVSRGRSAANATAIDAVKMGKAGAAELPPVFAAGHEGAWAIFRFGTEYPKVNEGLQFPLEAQEEFWKQMVPDWIAALPTPNPTVPALSALAQRLKGTVLMSHSQSGIYPFQTAALSNTGIAAIVSIEPGACPDAKGDLAPYLKVPIMILWGDYVDTSPRWSPRLKGCREFTQAANKLGGKVTHYVLPEHGINGNSHMLMQDKNNLQIAEMVADWIGKNALMK
ncbi:MAG: esterase [Betaproteobacteria bacterium]|nr:esterase [Betaproteobacteria bacterium]